jgi:hypothetical protein
MPARKGAAQRVVDQRGLPAARGAGDADHQAEGDACVDPTQGVAARAAPDEPASVGTAPALGEGNPPSAGEVLPGQPLAALG